MSLKPSTPKTAWTERFAVRLQRLQPGLSSTGAASLAARTFEEAADLAPEEAAEIVAVELPPTEVGAPGN